ncbi:MAG: translocation/assembly module TamB domain-containing protein [Alloprevotella sp.]|nr:translocation/assembly module TamB domain-containing protein [Alloprevotella sp.]
MSEEQNGKKPEIAETEPGAAAPTDVRPARRPLWSRALLAVARALWWCVAIAVGLVLAAGVLLYVPGVQRRAVREVCESLRASSGYDVRLANLRLGFPLHLSADSLLVLEEGDTLLAADALRLHLRAMPLLRAEADVAGLDLRGVSLDTRRLVGGVHVRGRLGRLSLVSAAGGRQESVVFNWETQHVRVGAVEMADADVAVVLSDTAFTDTLTSRPWLISVGGVRLRNVKARVALSGDVPPLAGTDSILSGRPQTWVALEVPRAKMLGGHFDTGRGIYAFQGLDLGDSRAAYTTRGRDGTWRRRTSPLPLPDDCKFTPRDTLHAHWDYTDNCAALEAWRPFDAAPTGRLDTENILLTDVNLHLNPFRYTDAGGVDVDVRSASLRERNSGLAVNGLKGRVRVDDDGLDLPDFELRTPYTTLRLGGRIPWSALSEGYGSVDMNLDVTLGWQDVTRLARGYVADDLLRRYPHRPLTLRGRLRGNTQHLWLYGMNLLMPDVVAGTLDGRIDNLTASPAADLSFNLRTGSLVPALFRQFAPDAAKTVRLPAAMTARGHFRNRPFGTGRAADNAVRLLCDLGVGQGSAHVEADIASLNGLGGTTRGDNWKLTAHTRAFPVSAFLPDIPLSPLSARISGSGNTFDVFAPGARVEAKAAIDGGSYGDINLQGLQADLLLRDGDATVGLAAESPALVASGKLTASIDQLASLGERDARDFLAGRLELDVTTADLRALGLTGDTIEGGGRLEADFRTDKDFRCFSAEGTVGNIFLQTNEQGFGSDDLRFSLLTDNDTTFVNAMSGDLELHAGANGNLDRLLPRLSTLADEAMRQVEQKSLDMEALKREFPPMRVYVTAKKENPLSGYLQLRGIAFDSVHINLRAHPESGLTGDAYMNSLSRGNLLLDELGLTLAQDTTGLALKGFVRNYKRKNPTKFDARLDGHIYASTAEIGAQFFDNAGEKSIDLGVRAGLADDGINVSLFPQHPVLAYRTFTLNTDNFIYLGEGGQIRADVDLVADDGTGLRILSEPEDSVNDITVSAYNINLTELSNVVPYLPKMDGMLNGDFHVLDNHETLSAMGSLEAKSFAYAGTSLGDVGADVVYLPQGEDEHFASAYIRAGESEVMQAEGTYYGKTDIFDGFAELHDFPMSLLNAFLEGSEVALDGHAGGMLSVKGHLDSPDINGSIALDSAHVYSPAYGFRFQMDEQPIPFEHSRIRFENYQLTSTGKNPLTLDGDINMKDFGNIRLNLAMQGKDFELINTPRTKYSTVFGTVFSDLTGSITGTLSNLTIRGKLDILEKTDMTYILKDSPLTVDNRLDDLVQFVSFEDSTYYDDLAEESLNINMILGINVSEDARFRCFLSEDGKSYASLVGGGALTFRYTPEGNMRLTGKLTAQSGDMKYELPVIPLRTFNLVEGSSIEFTGDPTNPTLSLQAKERMKVLITGEDDRQRAVAFDVGVALSNSLDNMGLEFTIEAPEDLTIQNQLASMTAEQRGKAAVAMMATGMYLTDSGSMSSGFKANNALNAFLQNEIQNIAGNALKTVDLSVGVESGTSMVGTQTTDYSFQFSKRFWGDRIRVVIGGRVSAGENADNRAESIINNVSVEYKLNRGATQYVRLFYDRDQQDPFEGQLTETGVGWSVRNKADSLGDLLLFWRKRKEEPQPFTAGKPAEDAATDENPETGRATTGTNNDTTTNAQ